MLSFGGFIPQPILLENINKSSHAPNLINWLSTWKVSRLWFRLNSRLWVSPVTLGHRWKTGCQIWQVEAGVICRKYCQFQDLCLRNRAGLNWLLGHDSRKPITNNTSSIHHVVLCVSRPTWELGENAPVTSSDLVPHTVSVNLWKSSIWGQKKILSSWKCSECVLYLGTKMQIGLG